MTWTNRELTRYDPRRLCTRCSRLLARSAFGKNARSADGLSSWCKRCAIQRTAEWRADHADAINRRRRRARRGAARAEDNDRRRALYAARRPTLEPRKCLERGELFTPTRPDQTYCSRPCAQRAYRRRRREGQGRG